MTEIIVDKAEDLLYTKVLAERIIVKDYRPSKKSRNIINALASGDTLLVEPPREDAYILDNTVMEIVLKVKR